VYEGAFRILRALGDGRSLSVDAIAREAGEATSVVTDVLRRYPKWFEQGEDGLRCSVVGLAALAREMVARGEERKTRASWLSEYQSIAVRRPSPKRELDQVYVTPETAARRAELLVRSGDHQRGLVFLGDDDLTSVAVQLEGAARRVTVLDTDPDVLRIVSGAAADHGWEIEAVHHDLREPIPKSMKGRFGAVFTDPPYALEGFSLFVSRAIEMMKPDGRFYVCFGFSRRASERGLQKQRALGEAGLVVEAVFEDFNAYEGAEAIGSRSSLWRCAMTPEARPIIKGRLEGPLYTSRPNEP
jgi:predicted methyltransferase